MTEPGVYIDSARFAVNDSIEVVAACLVCPWCLELPAAGRATDVGLEEEQLELDCESCSGNWMIRLSELQRVRLQMIPPPGFELVR